MGIMRRSKRSPRRSADELGALVGHWDRSPILARSSGQAGYAAHSVPRTIASLRSSAFRVVQ